MEMNYINKYQQVIIATVLQCYYGNDKDMEVINSIELKEEYFTGYFKSIVRAINILRQTSPIVNDDMVEQFLIEKKHFNARVFISILTTTGTPLSCLRWYIGKLQAEYTKGLLR